MSEINYNEELPGGVFPVDIILFDQHQHKYPSLLAKYIIGIYQKGYFCGRSNININLITCEYNIFIP